MDDKIKMLLIFLIILMIPVAALATKAILQPVDTIDKSIEMGYEVNEQILDGENAIYNYEWFIQQEEDIEALYKKELRAQLEVDQFLEDYPDKDKWTKWDKDEYSRLRSNVTAVSNVLDDAIAEYNAKSDMVSRNVFKGNLPTNIGREFYVAAELITQ